METNNVVLKFISIIFIMIYQVFRFIWNSIIRFLEHLQKKPVTYFFAIPILFFVGQLIYFLSLK